MNSSIVVADSTAVHLAFSFVFVCFGLCGPCGYSLWGFFIFCSVLFCLLAYCCIWWVLSGIISMGKEEAGFVGFVKTCVRSVVVFFTLFLSINGKL